MRKDEWVTRPIDQRLQWYREQINSLVDSIKDEKASANGELLQELKKRMIYDGTPSENRMSEDSEREKQYYESVYSAYKALPNIDTDTKKWPEKLVETRELLVDSG